MAYHGSLLGILLPKVGTSGSHHIEELEHYGGYPVEMSGTASPFQPLGQRTSWANVGDEALGINGCHRWGKDDIGACGLKQVQVTRKITGVARKIFMWPKLGWVHEDAD